MISECPTQAHKTKLGFRALGEAGVLF